MFAATIGPETFAPDDRGVNFAYRLEISQKLPFPGKLKLRGENALAEASAAGHDVEDVRLQLIESVQDAFYEYDLVERGLEVNADGLKFWQQTKKDAASRYETGKVDQQDVLQADVEFGREQERRLTLEEIQAARPLRIKVITVQPGDTVESLSHRMAGIDHPADRFRILNGLDNHAQVKVRDVVKIVVD